MKLPVQVAAKFQFQFRKSKLIQISKDILRQKIGNRSYGEPHFSVVLSSYFLLGHHSHP
jgi:hypothetical protein